MKHITKKDFNKIQLLIDHDESLEYATKELAMNILKRIYGDAIEPSIISRLNYEIEEFNKGNYLKTIIEVAIYMANMKERGDLFLSRLSYSNSLLYYLLGIGSVNPLPRHRYCSKCHTFYWGDKKTNYCECCGEELKEDGYDLPFELLLDEINRLGLKFHFSSTKTYKHKRLPIKFFQNDLIKLAKQLDFKQDELEDNNININDVLKVMNCLSLSLDSDGLLYDEFYKKNFICHHVPFIGISDLSLKPFVYVIYQSFEGYVALDDLIKAVAMSHGTGVLSANINYICETLLINEDISQTISTRDELYNILIESQLNKDDVLLILRETRLHGDGHLSELSEFKLKQAGVDENYINFFKNISYIFYKGHTVSHVRAEVKIALIYLSDPLRYYKAYFTINKDKLLKMDKEYDFIKGFSLAKSTDLEELYLAGIDLMERGYNPRKLIEDVLNS